MGVVGGEQRDVHPARQLDELLVQAGLLGDAGVLDLDEVVPVAQDGPIVVGDLHGRLLVALGQALSTSPPRQALVAISPSL